LQILRHERGDVKSGDTYRIWFLADLHLGHCGCDKKLLKKTVDRISDTDPHTNRVFLLGDILDAIAVTDKRFAMSSLDDDIRNSGRDDVINQQINLAVDMLTPLKGRIDALLIGNHEQMIVRKASSDPLEHIGRALEADYNGSVCAYVRHVWPEKTNGNKGHGHSWRVDSQLHHGAGGGYLSGGKILRMERRAHSWPTADIIVSGHTHKRFVTTTSLMVAGESNPVTIKEKTQHIFSVGSFLRGYHDQIKGVSYVEMADYAPTDLGALYADIEMQYTYDKKGKNCGRRPYIHWGNV